MKTTILSLLVFIFILAACNTTNSSVNSSTEKSIAGIQWHLKKIRLSSGDIDVKEKTAFIKFDADKNAAGGNGGCNTFGSNYKINENFISFKNVFSTKMFCEKNQQIENNFFSQLEQVNRYDVADEKLLLYKDNELLLEFGK